MKNTIENEIESSFDAIGHVYRFTLHVTIGTSETWVSGYLPHGNKDIRLNALNGNPQIGDALVVIQYINFHKDWYISQIITVAEGK